MSRPPSFASVKPHSTWEGEMQPRSSLVPVVTALIIAIEDHDLSYRGRSTVERGFRDRLRRRLHRFL